MRKVLPSIGCGAPARSASWGAVLTVLLVALTGPTVFASPTTSAGAEPSHRGAPAGSALEAGAAGGQIQIAEGSQLLLRRTYNSSRVVYVDVEGRLVAYEHDDSHLFPVVEELPVRVRKVDVRSDRVEIEYEHTALGRGRIRADLDDLVRERSDLRDLAVARIVNTAFRFPGVADDYVPVYGNRDTRVAHFAGSNHVPGADHRHPFDSLEEADAAGYRACSVCFFNLPRVAEYQMERALGAECAATVRYYYKPVANEEEQAWMRALGSRVIEDWPLPERGYPYTFELVESDDVNAMACPAGRVFVTTALRDVIEDESELEAVMAHEIAHAELRHGYRQLKSAQRAAMWAGLVVAAAAVAGEVADDDDSGDAGTAAAVAAAISTVAASIVLSGYSRDHEMESDALARIYLQSKPGATQAVALDSVLRKLRYSAQVRGFNAEGGGLFGSHPNINARIEAVENSVVSKFDDVVFEGYSRNGELVATLEFVMQAFSRADNDFELAVLGTIETTPALGESAQVKDLEVFSAGRKIKLDNKEDTRVWPSAGAGFVLRTDDERALLRSIDSINFKLRNVEQWRRR